MNPAAFEYHRAQSVDDAIALLGRYGGESKLLAGGHSLLPVMKLRLAEPAHLIDIGALNSLRGVRADGDGLWIGALTTHHDLEREPLVRERFPLLAETASMVGDRQVRNRGTFGGALAHADAAADYPAAVLAAGCEMIARGPNGERAITVDDFFVDFLMTALEPDEILTGVRVPARATRSGGAYQKLASQASGYATVGVAVLVALDDGGRCTDARIGVTGAVASARRATATEEALIGAALDPAAIATAADLAAVGLEILGDFHASAEYRMTVLRGLTRRALQTATERASVH